MPAADTSAPHDDALSPWFCDLHIHIGRSSGGLPVKITASRDLTFANIARECVERKGIDLVGVIDCASPPVIADIRAMLETGEMVELPGGGVRFRDKVTIILAAEIETVEADGAASHHVGYFPTLDDITAFSEEMSRHITNMQLSSQRCGLPVAEFQRIVEQHQGFLMPAHVFTPHKSAYGNCTARLGRLFGEDGYARIPAVELGLSSDTDLADHISELAGKTFLSNSDAHSLPKIAREYNVIRMAEPTFSELRLALLRAGDRTVIGNFGMDPRLGKYHRTYCPNCDRVEENPPPVNHCTLCGNVQVVRGVLDRIIQIADYAEPVHPDHRPPYHYQVPLQFVPKVGSVALQKLLNRFGTEMQVLHIADPGEMEAVVGREAAANILLARRGELRLQAGGGGKYGRAVSSEKQTQLSLFG